MTSTTTSLEPRVKAGCALLILALALAACNGGDPATTVATPGAAAKATGATAAASTTYSVVNLSVTTTASVTRRSVNATGQVAFSDFAGIGGLAFFYDGTIVRYLGVLPGGSYSVPFAVNDSGQVVGYAEKYAGNNVYVQHTFSWTPAGGMMDLGTAGNLNSAAFAVNNSGQVVGRSQISDNSLSHALSWTAAGEMIDLGTLGGTASYATDVNGSGQVVGGATTATGLLHAFSWTRAAGMVDLGTLGGNYSEAIAVNSSGQVVGRGATANGLNHAFSWTAAGGMVDMGTFAGGTGSSVLDVNSSGQAVGCSDDGINYHAFSWTTANGMVDLGALDGSFACAFAINSSGVVVGQSLTGTGFHAFVWTPTDGMVDLNTRIPTAPPNLVVYDARAISDNGSIVANSTAGLVLLKPGTLNTAAPAVGPIMANDPIAVGERVSVTASFTDADTADTHTATWTWADGSAAGAGTVSEANGSGTVGGSHIYNAAGVYPVTVTVTDNTGKSAQVQRGVVVYDPSAGFVTGGGWINSPPGAYRLDTTLAGLATFGFVSKYQKGATKPTGTTDFEFRTANLNFHSENYDWLVVGGARAQYKGSGTINGTGSYQFMLTAVDGDLLGKGNPDRFRMKIWHHDATTSKDVIDYDNQLDSTTEGTTSEGTQIGGGSIVVHK